MILNSHAAIKEGFVRTNDFSHRPHNNVNDILDIKDGRRMLICNILVKKRFRLNVNQYKILNSYFSMTLKWWKLYN